MKYSILLLLLLTQCGKISVEGIPKKIEVEHSVSLTQIEGYFQATCIDELGGTATQSEIEVCTEARLGDFLLYLEGK